MNKNIELLLDHITVICEIECSKCDTKLKLYNTEDYELATDLDADGWKATQMNVLCPKCVKKKKEKKK